MYEVPPGHIHGYAVPTEDNLPMDKTRRSFSTFKSYMDTFYIDGWVISRFNNIRIWNRHMSLSIV